MGILLDMIFFARFLYIKKISIPASYWRLGYLFFGGIHFHELVTRAFNLVNSFSSPFVTDRKQCNIVRLDSTDDKFANRLGYLFHNLFRVLSGKCPAVFEQPLFAV